MKKIKAVILRNEIDGDHSFWIKACNEHEKELEYRIVNLTKNTWLEEIQSENFDILLAKPAGHTNKFKQLYDERIYILNKILGHSVYPSADEIFIYENKRFLSYWLKANRIPCPKTEVFYDRTDAIDFINLQDFPIVVKANIGASGSGVSILKSKNESLRHIHRTFSGKGAHRRIGPNLSSGGLIKRGIHYFAHPKDIKKKISSYRTISTDPQIGFIIFQEYITHNYEWRVVRIGDSFFAHKKLKIGEKASGSLLKEYGRPPFALLDFVKSITDRHQFHSQAIDVFESDKGYLVNEMQCVFGQSDPYQMLVDGIPGRFRFIGGEWNFEEGTFNNNESFNLRVNYVLNSFK